MYWTLTFILYSVQKQKSLAIPNITGSAIAFLQINDASQLGCPGGAESSVVASASIGLRLGQNMPMASGRPWCCHVLKCPEVS